MNIDRVTVSAGLLAAIALCAGCAGYEGPPLEDVAAACDLSRGIEDDGKTLIAHGWDETHCVLGEMETPESVAQQIKTAPVGDTGGATSAGATYDWTMGTLLATSTSSPDLIITTD